MHCVGEVNLSFISPFHFRSKHRPHLINQFVFFLISIWISLVSITWCPCLILRSTLMCSLSVLLWSVEHGNLLQEDTFSPCPNQRVLISCSTSIGPLVTIVCAFDKIQVLQFQQPGALFGVYKYTDGFKNHDTNVGISITSLCMIEKLTYNFLLS